MSKYVASISPALIRELEESFRQGPILDDQGRRMFNEKQFGRINSMSVQIYANEHPPPHFHIRYAGADASYALDTGSRLPGIKGLEKYDRNISKWWKDNRCALILAWNSSRPPECTVGPVDVPAECPGSDAGEE
jgi:hypothetical protein